MIEDILDGHGDHLSEELPDGDPEDRDGEVGRLATSCVLLYST